MQKCFGIFCVSLIFCATVSETIGLVIAAKEKRGWTLNSAGYLLGPHGIDGHRTLGDKPGLAGKRDMGQDEDFRTGALRIADEDIIHTVIDFLSYLRLKVHQQVVQKLESWRFDSHSRHSKRLVELTAGGVAVHLLVMAEVPLSKAPYPHAPWALNGCPPLQVGICL
ncbi:galanin peptides isoform 2-T3 [Odontesthes bonariensis]|uniref:galanin peptides isoform X2 n=1 Tax=Odontesthes bonariensis TaxID=219752 RepID=UPI003F58B1D1